MGKKKTSISVDETLLKWISEKINEKKFASVSHAVEYALFKLKTEEG
jgi:Arc/MetJ-type ribon-helix-helix transcriptional regulator